jgi:hypothetical protein
MAEPLKFTVVLRSMREDGDPIPQPTSTAATAEVAA